MGTAVHVPQTRDMLGDELSGDEALTALRRYGGLRLLADSFTRFRYADGFTNARALAFQVVLGLVPFTVVLVGLATSVHTGERGPGHRADPRPDRAGRQRGRRRKGFRRHPAQRVAATCGARSRSGWASGSRC